jgi:hypothetical protein
LALVIAPKNTEVHSPEWFEDFLGAFSKLDNPSQWFIPSKDQLLLARAVIPNEFTERYYWSSTVVDRGKKGLCVMVFRGGIHITFGSFPATVRAFRCISY